MLQDIEKIINSSKSYRQITIAINIFGTSRGYCSIIKVWNDGKNGSPDVETPICKQTVHFSNTSKLRRNRWCTWFAKGRASRDGKLKEIYRYTVEYISICPIYREKYIAIFDIFFFSINTHPPPIISLINDKINNHFIHQIFSISIHLS